MVTVSPPNPESRQIAAYLSDLDQRMKRVEAGLRTMQLSNSSLEGSGIVMYDPDGNYRGTVGFQGDGTTTVTSQNPFPPPVPSAPQVTPAMGCLKVSHTGETQSGTPNPADFSHLNVYVAPSSSPSDRTFTGTINPVPGEFVVSGLDYTDYLVDVTAVNLGGKESIPSPPIEAAPQKVVSDDIIEGAFNELTIADGAITEAKIAAGAVTETKIADDSISTPKIIAGAVGASEIAAGSILAGHIVSRTITADRLTALTLTANEIAANAITTAKIQAGSVTASKLEADMVIAQRIIAGTPTGPRVEMHPTLGLQGIRADGSRTFWIDSTTGNFTAVGSIATAFSGQRIVMNYNSTEPDTIRLFQTNDTYAIIFADPAGAGAGIFMKGSSTNSGKIGAYAGEGFTSWLDGGLGLSRTAFDATSNTATMWAGSNIIDSRERWGSGDTVFRWRNSSDTIYNTMELKFLHMGGGQPCLWNGNWDLGLTWDGVNGAMVVQGVSPSAYKPIMASAFTVSSGQMAKKNLKPVELNRTSSSRQGISEVIPKQWHYNGEWDGTGNRPPPSTWNAPEVVRDEEGKALVNDDGTTKYEDNWMTGAEVQAVKPHIGLVAEDVIGVFPELLTTSDSVDGGFILNITDAVGLLWDAVHDEVIDTATRGRKLPRGVSGGTNFGTVIDSFYVPPDPPTSGALMYEFGGSVYIVSYTGKRSKVV